MMLDVENKEISVGQVKIYGVSSSSLVLVGDANTIQLASSFDTPPESFVIGPLLPLGPEG
ncbi:spore gernimation protein GerPD [Fervidibacillus halotolerans]|uniref:Spore gernimation protein GerPD n=1 Tax=Fervidibacillus halotolerans TaxID=2980027 RepID=A0A9E8RZ83_9BACI|nr:spore gernimation protein GerPD [Fervidibacillus halotolerans]WAA13038.1 spore gernimation protein GerPD [Fervidibacillus halotolerans]